ncbi:MAG: Gfo/Idh/MocA family oxidoreductase [Nitrososphaerota archaeon]|nr:Gfo/Idh/MocA family oxidoreductase [Nitrososphaerota archaeon]
MRENLRIGVAGVGFWGKNHIRVLRELGVSVEAICDIDRERAESMASYFGVKKFYTDLREMLRKEDLHAVTICTPSSTHAECAIMALESGLDVFVEKPLAFTVEECLRIIDSMKSNNKIVMTGFIERFNPAVSKAIQLLEMGEIGEVIMSHGRRIGWWPQRIGDVGVVKDTAIHDIDLVRFIFKQDPIQVYAKGGSQRHHLDDHVQAILTLDDESKVAFIEANWLTPRKKREMHITGSDGVLSIRFLTQEVSLEKADMAIEPIIKQDEPLKLELRHFVECVKKREKPLADAIDGLKAVAIAEAILESMKWNKIIDIDLENLI